MDQHWLQEYPAHPEIIVDFTSHGGEGGAKAEGSPSSIPYGDKVIEVWLPTGSYPSGFDVVCVHELRYVFGFEY